MSRRIRPPAVEPPESSRRNGSADGPPTFPPNTIHREGGVAPWVVALMVVLFLVVGGLSVYFFSGDKSSATQVAEDKPVAVEREGVILRKDPAYYSDIHLIYLAIEFDNKGTKEVFTGYATGERVEVPMAKVGDTVTFTTKPGEIEVINLRIDWSKRPELAK